MNLILKSIRLDNAILSVYYRPFLLVAYGLAVLIAVPTKVPGLAIVIVMALSAPFVGVHFSLYEKNNLSRLYGVLPLGKNEVVIGRYLYSLAFGLANGIAASSLAYIISLVVHARMSQREFLTYACVPFAYFCLYVAVQFPIYFEFTFSKVYLLSNLPFYLAVVAAEFLYRKDNLLHPSQPVIQFFTANPNRIWETSLGLGLLLLLLSFPLSFYLHQKSEL